MRIVYSALMGRLCHVGSTVVDGVHGGSGAEVAWACACGTKAGVYGLADI